MDSRLRRNDAAETSGSRFQAGAGAVLGGKLMSQPKRIFVVAGEHSGDVLGGKLMEALKAKAGAQAFEFAGVGGEHMEAAGLRSIFPLSDVAVMGLAAILARLPTLVRRVYQTADAALAFNPDALIIID